VVIAPEAIDDLVAVLVGRGYQVVGPTIRDGAIVVDEVSGRGDLPVGWGDRQGPGTYELVRHDDAALFGYAVGPQTARHYLDPPRRRVWSASYHGGRFVVEEEPPPTTRYALLGVRPCELAAIAVQDRILRDGHVPDPTYTALRDASFVVVVNCGAPADTCFCTSLGTGPAAASGFDLALTEITDPPHRLLVEAATPAGADVLATLLTRPATDTDVAAARAVVARSAERITRRIDPHEARDVLAANLDHPTGTRWPRGACPVPTARWSAPPASAARSRTSPRSTASTRSRSSAGTRASRSTTRTCTAPDRCGPTSARATASGSPTSSRPGGISSAGPVASVAGGASPGARPGST
jgi:hypothetical protein